MKRFFTYLTVVLAILIPIVAIASVIEGVDGDRKRKSIGCETIADGRCILKTMSSAKVDDDSIANCDDLAASSEQYTLPTANDEYEIRVTGNCASILCGASPTATTAKTGHFIKVCDGVPFKGPLVGPKCAHIAPSADGEICYVHLNSAL